MSNRIVKHSSRYKGPAGDSRAPAEIFKGIEERAQQAKIYRDKLLALMDEIMDNATLMTWPSRADLVRDTAIEWLVINHPDFAERAEQLKKQEGDNDKQL